MAAPLAAGLIWDRTGSYAIALWLFSGMWVVGAVIFFFLRPPGARPELAEQSVPPVSRAVTA